MIFSNLQNKIELECIKCFSEIRKQYSDETICGYALFSDSDATSVSAAINSKRLLKKIIHKLKKMILKLMKHVLNGVLVIGGTKLILQNTLIT